MQFLNKDNVNKSQVNTIEQFKVLDYLKKIFDISVVKLYLIDKYTIKLIDKNNKIGYFKYNPKTQNIDFYEKNIKNKEMER